MQQLESPGNVQRELLKVFDVEHRQTVNRGGLGAHPIVVDHVGKSLRNFTIPHTGQARHLRAGLYVGRTPITCCSLKQGKIWP